MNTQSAASSRAGEVIIAYVPVLHEGYRRFFDNHPRADALYLLGTEITKDYKQLVKDIRALPPALIKDSLAAWKRFKTIEIISSADWKMLGAMAAAGTSIVMPDEDIMRELAEKHIPGVGVSFDSIFLRWDKHKSFEQQPVQADQTISTDSTDNAFIALLRTEAGKSSDFWRHIASAVVKDDKIILKAHNHHVPLEQTPYIDGDPRSDFSKGVNLDLSTAIHSEASLVAEAARLGISLQGASLYVTTFPCPPCAKLIAYSGVKKLYYADGYGVLDGERILKSRGVEIIFVKGK